MLALGVDTPFYIAMYTSSWPRHDVPDIGSVGLFLSHIWVGVFLGWSEPPDGKAPWDEFSFLFFYFHHFACSFSWGVSSYISTIHLHTAFKFGMIPFSITGSEFQAVVILWTIGLCAWRQFSDFLEQTFSFIILPHSPLIYSFHILFLLSFHLTWLFPIPAYEHDIT